MKRPILHSQQLVFETPIIQAQIETTYQFQKVSQFQGWSEKINLLCISCCRVQLSLFFSK